jgi:hypothetical protein
MKKYSTQFKLKVVKSFLAGKGGAKLLSWQWLVNVSDGLKQSMVVKPSDPFKRCHFDALNGFPGRAAVNHLGFVQAV